MSKDRKILLQIYGARYSRIYALNRDDWNRCFYCGDISTELDHVPPLVTIEFFDMTREQADFFLVPSCNECNLLGGSEPHGLLETRAEYIRQKLKRRNSKLWRQIQLWTKSEVDEFIETEGETSITRVLSAIVGSEEALKSRLQFSGYPFEVRGSKQFMSYEPTSRFSVFGPSFDSFKEALQYCITSYKVKADVLYQYAVAHGGNLEKALNQIFEEQALLIKEKELEIAAKELSLQYNTSQEWVFRSLRSLKSKYTDSTLDELKKILVEKYILKK